ncbi:MAG: nucleotidyltransferase domain-containing protein [Defluviitaleaceae bacterium]|nr:nucleotidyltransferase domain-containing protein [Defluviitaleaceae bacterium]
MLTHKDICKAVGDMAERYNISKAYYFGSYAKGTFDDDSDLDLLVDFHTPYVSLFSTANLAVDLKETLQIKVDVLKLPLPKDTILKIDKVVKCYGIEG